MKFKKQLIKNTKYKNGNKNSKKYITVHQTGNESIGAGAQAHANLQSNVNSRQASWHYQVDDKEAIQSFTHDFQLWHAGKGNNNSISIEICMNSDSDYNKTMLNAVELIKKIMTEERIPLSNVVQHNYWTGKNCPSGIRAGRNGWTWNIFKQKIVGVILKPTPVKQTKTIDMLVAETRAGKHGNGNQRKKSLGSNYQKVQDIINGKIKTKSIDTLVAETIAGKHGNGNQRRKSLGANYQAVQNKINNIFR